MKIKRWQKKISQFQQRQPQALLWINCVLGSLFLHGLGFLLFFMLLTLDDSSKNKLANLIKIPIDFITLKTPILPPKPPVKNVDNPPEKPTSPANKTEQSKNNQTTDQPQVNPSKKDNSTELNTAKNLNQSQINKIYTNNISAPMPKNYEINSGSIKNTLFRRKPAQNQTTVNPIKTNNYLLDQNPVVKNQFNRYNSLNNWDNKRNTSRDNLNQFIPIAPPANRILPPIDPNKSNNIATNNINTRKIISTENNVLPSITVPTIKVERLVATVISYSSSNENTNIPDISAKPLIRQTEILSPSLNSGTATLKMTLLVNTQGTATVQSATLIDGISTTNSQQLAAEIIQKWQFKPATQGGQPMDSLVQMSIKVRKR
jgi:hypothetical protein